MSLLILFRQHGIEKKSSRPLTLSPFSSRSKVSPEFTSSRDVTFGGTIRPLLVAFVPSTHEGHC